MQEAFQSPRIMNRIIGLIKQYKLVQVISQEFRLYCK